MWPNPQETSDLVTFTEEILNENFIFCAVEYGSNTSQIVKFPLKISPVNVTKSAVFCGFVHID